MREILFRGKRIDNGEWVYGYIVKHGVCWWIYPGERYIAEECIEEFKLTFNHSVKFEVDPETICQYTGLTDKNGKKIFEGDIAEAWSEGSKATGIVKNRIDGLWIMYPAYQNGEFWGLCPDIEGETTVKIVGNIFDNPELLEVQE